MNQFNDGFKICQAMELIRHCSTLTKAIRHEAKLNVRQPLNESWLCFNRSLDNLLIKEYIEELVYLYKDETNIKNVKVVWNIFNVMIFSVKLNKLAAKKYKADFQKVNEYVLNLDSMAATDLVLKLMNNEQCEHNLTLADIEVACANPGYFRPALDVQKGLCVLVDTRMTPELLEDGTIREFIRHVQKARKDAGLEFIEKVGFAIYEASDSFKQLTWKYRNLINEELLIIHWTNVDMKHKVKIELPDKSEVLFGFEERPFVKI